MCSGTGVSSSEIRPEGRFNLPRYRTYPGHARQTVHRRLDREGDAAPVMQINGR